MHRKSVGAALAAALIAVSALTFAPATSGAATNPQEGEHDVLVNPNPVDTTPHVLNGNTQAVLDLGSRVIVGGKFTQVKRWNQSTVFARTNIFAYNKATGAIDTVFVPQLNGQVTSLLRAPDGKVFVAGQFKTVDGVNAQFLVKLDPVTGVRDASFNAQPNGMVYDIHLHGNTLYAGGTFTRLRSLVRTNFGLIDATTGAPIAGPDVAFAAGATGFTRVMRLDVSPDGTSLVAIGNFTLVAGQTRQNIAKLDVTATTAAVNSWFTDRYRYGQCSSSYDTFIRDVDYSPDGRYFVAVATGAYFGSDRLCDTAARWENSGTGTVSPTWVDHTGGDTLSAVAITGAAVYIGGHQRWANNAIPPGGDRKGPGAVDRVGIAALDAESGVPLSWNPGRERGITVWRIVPTAEGLYVVSDSNLFAGEWHPRLSYLLTTGGVAPAKATPATLPTQLTYAGSTTAGSPPSGQLFGRPYDGAALGTQAQLADTSNWSQVAGVVVGTDRTYRFLSNGVVQVGTDGVNWTTQPNWFNLNNLRGAAYGPGPAGRGRLFYRINNDSNLYGRGFTIENGLLSSLGFTVSGPGVDGTNWTGTNGLTVIADKLYHAHSDGTLRRTDLVDGRPVMATTITISGPLVDGLNWANTVALHSRGEAVPPPPPPPPPDHVFETAFDDLNDWTTVQGLTLDTNIGAPTGTPPSAFADVNGTKAFARKSLGASYSDLCSVVSVQLNRQTTATVLMRLRTAANGPGGRLHLAANGGIYIRNDAAGVQSYAGSRLLPGTWTRFELCATAGPGGALTLSINGVPSASIAAGLPDAGFGIVEIGDAVNNSWSANFDDLVVDEPE